MQCTQCGYVNAPEDRFCTACGTTLGPTCPSCGRSVTDEDRFCPFCGAPATAPAAEVPGGAYGEPVGFLARLASAAGLAAHATPDGGPIDRHLEPGTQVIVRRRAGDWCFVWTEDGWMGWVREAGLVDPDDPEGIYEPPEEETPPA